MVSYTYDAWGNILEETVHNTAPDAQTTVVHNIATHNPFKYKGYIHDEETGFYYLKSRYYDPDIGRFISPDSINYIDPTSFEGLNLFAYCKNNPVMYADPNGNIPQWAINLLIGTAIVVATALFVAAIVASAGAVGALAGAGAAAIGLSATTVSTVTTVATVSTYVVATGVGLFGASDAIEAYSGGTNPIRDYVFAGNQTAYDITSGTFNTLGSLAVIAGSVAPTAMQQIAKKSGTPKMSKGKVVGYTKDMFDKKGGWNIRIDATTHGNPNSASWHHNPHYHILDRSSKGIPIYYFWEVIKGWF